MNWFRRLQAEQLERRELLSGTWTPISEDYPIDNHKTAVAPMPTKHGITIFHKIIAADAYGESTSGQFTDNLSATTKLQANGKVTGQLKTYSVNTQADVQKVDAVGQLEGGAGTSHAEATQAYAHSEFYVQGSGVGIFSINVSARTQLKHIWAAGSSSETTTDLNTVTGQINVNVIGTFTISVQALTGNEKMDFTMSDTEGYDYARTKTAIANLSVSIVTTGMFSVTATGNSNCGIEWLDDYGGALSAGKSYSRAFLNARTTGNRGNVMFSAVANQSDVSGYADDLRAKETLYDSHSGFSTDNSRARSSGRLNAETAYDNRSDIHTQKLSPRGAMRISTSASTRVAPPADSEIARQEIWSDVRFLESLFFNRSL